MSIVLLFSIAVEVFQVNRGLLFVYNAQHDAKVSPQLDPQTSFVSFLIFLYIASASCSHVPVYCIVNGRNKQYQGL